MQTITSIVLAVHLRWIRFVLDSGGKIDNKIEIPFGFHKLIDLLASLLMTATVITVSTERRDCGTNRDKSSFLGIRCNLLERIGHRTCRCAIADVVHTFEDHDILYARLLEGVAFIAGERWGAETS